MEAQAYLTAWGVYLAAALGLSAVAWRLLRRFLLLDLAILAQCLLLALLFTPWYVLPEQKILAPAVIVALMDGITISPQAAVRALTPLVMALLGAIVLALLLIVAIRFLRHGRRKLAE